MENKKKWSEWLNMESPFDDKIEFYREHIEKYKEDSSRREEEGYILGIKTRNDALSVVMYHIGKEIRKAQAQGDMAKVIALQGLLYRHNQVKLKYLKNMKVNYLKHQEGAWVDKNEEELL